MLTPDLCNRTYTAEVLRTRVEPDAAVKTVSGLTSGPRTEEKTEEAPHSPVKVLHSFLTSKRQYHRATRTVVSADGREVDVPRRTKVRGSEQWLYDVFLAQCSRHIVVAVPFHGLAEEFFVRVDGALAGTRTLYERLNITNMVIRLGPAGVTEVWGDSAEIHVTRCHLAYEDTEGRSRDLQQLRMTGANLGKSQVYRGLVKPVLAPADSVMTVTPVILGFALSANGVKKSGATTDRHGNFKLWIGPGLRQLTRLFGLLEAIEAMENVVSTTSNLPILQSGMIRGAED